MRATRSHVRNAVLVIELDAGRRVGIRRDVRSSRRPAPSRPARPCRGSRLPSTRCRSGRRPTRARRLERHRPDPAPRARSDHRGVVTRSHSASVATRSPANRREWTARHDVDRPVVERNVREIGLDELGLRHLASSDLEHPRRAVEADDPPPLSEGQVRSRARPGADVEDRLTWTEVGPTDDLRGDRDQGRRDRGRIVARGAREGRRAAERHARWRPDEALDAVQRLDDLLVRGGVADPDVAGARRSERGSWHDRRRAPRPAAARRTPRRRARSHRSRAGSSRRRPSARSIGRPISLKRSVM